MNPDVMWDGERWWQPCPLAPYPQHKRRAWRDRNLPGHAYDRERRCWLPASPSSFAKWPHLATVQARMHG